MDEHIEKEDLTPLERFEPAPEEEKQEEKPKKTAEKKVTKKQKKVDEDLTGFSAEMILTPIQAYKKERLGEAEELNDTFVNNFKISVNAVIEKYDASVIQKYPEVPCLMFFVAIIIDGVGIEQISKMFKGLSGILNNLTGAIKDAKKAKK